MTEAPPQRSLALLQQPVSIAFLVAFRVLLGGVLATSAMRFLVYGWVDELFVQPKMHFHHWLTPFVVVPPAPWIHLLFGAVAVLGALVALGWQFRLTAPLLAVCFTWIQLADVTLYLNHYYLAVILAWLLAASPAHRALSLDVRAGRATGLTQLPAAWLWLLRAQLAVVYTYAGIAKLHDDWLLYGQPLGIWLGASTDLPLVGPLFTLPHVPLLMSWAGFVFDSTIAWWLLWPRTRLVAFGVVVVFHVWTRLLFPIGMFPFLMMLGALGFFAPDWPLQLPWLGRRMQAHLSAHAVGQPPRVARFALALMALHLVVQVLFPLRCFLYPDHVRWHEQGMRWSWRVMVREKNGTTVFAVHAPTTGRRWQVQPRKYLTSLQEREMAGQPDLILQLAQRIAADARASGWGEVEVRAEALVSLNGRRAQLLVDPQRDLAKVRDGLAPYDWVLPPPKGPPPAIRPL